MAATYSNGHRKLEACVDVVKQDGINTDKNVNIGVSSGVTPNLWVAGNVSIGGTLTTTGTGMEGAQVISAASANALAVGANGITNPVLNIDTSETSVATGLQIEGFAAGSTVALETLSSGTNESMTIDAKGTGAISLNSVLGTGAVQLGGAASGANATGLKVTPNAAASGLAAAVVSTGTNENLTLDAKGSGTITLGGVSTGKVVVAGGAGGSGSLQIGDGTITKSSGFNFNFGNGGISNANVFQTGNSSNANALTVGPNALTNASFNVDTSTASAATGLNIKSAAAGSGLAVTTISSGAAENLTVAAKGTTGTITFNPAITATAGGAVADGIQIGSLSVGLYTGTGTPTFSAMNGSIYVDSNATTTTTRIYVNKSGAGTAGTTWTNLTTAA